MIVNKANEVAVFNLFEESEWTAAETELETAVELIELQLQIASWQKQWQKIWNDEENRNLIAQVSGNWSKNILEKSGLI